MIKWLLLNACCRLYFSFVVLLVYGSQVKAFREMPQESSPTASVDLDKLKSGLDNGLQHPPGRWFVARSSARETNPPNFVRNEFWSDGQCGCFCAYGQPGRVRIVDSRRAIILFKSPGKEEWRIDAFYSAKKNPTEYLQEQRLLHPDGLVGRGFGILRSLNQDAGQLLLSFINSGLIEIDRVESHSAMDSAIEIWFKQSEGEFRIAMDRFERARKEFEAELFAEMEADLALAGKGSNKSSERVQPIRPQEVIKLRCVVLPKHNWVVTEMDWSIRNPDGSITNSKIEGSDLVERAGIWYPKTLYRNGTLDGNAFPQVVTSILDFQPVEESEFAAALSLVKFNLPEPHIGQPDNAPVPAENADPSRISISIFLIVGFCLAICGILVKRRIGRKT